MEKVAAPEFRPPATSSADPRLEAYVGMLRAAITAIPMDRRREVFQQIKDLVPPRTPRRGGVALDNVVELFREDGRPEWIASEVVAALAERGKPTASKKVYGALTYLNGLRILKRVGYGRYIVEGGGLVVTNDLEER